MEIQRTIMQHKEQKQFLCYEPIHIQRMDEGRLPKLNKQNSKLN